MASGDMDIQVAIRAFLDAKGFEDAQRRLAELSAAASKSKGPMNDLAEGQRLSTREVKALTRELLYSVGATQGAGSAGRLAATAFMALGDSAEIANFAMAGFGFGLAFLLPRLIEMVSGSEQLHEENSKVIESLLSEREKIDRLIEKVPELAAKYEVWAKALKQVAYDQQVIQIQELFKKVEKLQEEIDKGPSLWDRFRAAVTWTGSMFEPGSEAAKKYGETLKNNKDAIAALMEQIYQLSDAVARGTVQTDEDTAAQKRAEDAKKAREDADRAYQQQVTSFQRAVDEEAAADLRDAQQNADAHRKLEETDANEFIRETNRKRKAEEDFYNHERELERQQQEQKLRDQTQTMASYGQVATALSSLFGKNKALAIAGAVIDTYAAANQVLRDPSLLGTPYLRWALAAAAIATGMANVASIEGQKLGFDSPFADSVARQLGDRSAADFVEHFGSTFVSGVRSGMSGMMAGGSTTTIDRHQVFNITANGVVGDRVAFRRWLEREQVQAERIRGRTSMGRS